MKPHCARPYRRRLDRMARYRRVRRGGAEPMVCVMRIASVKIFERMPDTLAQQLYDTAQAMIMRWPFPVRAFPVGDMTYSDQHSFTDSTPIVRQRFEVRRAK